MATDFIDVALIFDPETRTVDAELGEGGDLLLDETALTPMLIRSAATAEPGPTTLCRRAATPSTSPPPSSPAAARSAMPSTPMAAAPAQVATAPFDLLQSAAEFAELFEADQLYWSACYRAA